MSGRQRSRERVPKTAIVALLLASARPSRLGAEEIAALAARVTDWRAFWEAASGHSLRPLVCRALRSASYAHVPEGWRQAFEQNLRLVLGQNLAFSTELMDVLELLGSNGIPTIPYKGPALALEAYGDIGLREFMDLDLLVLQRDVAHLTKTMSGAGYALRTSIETPREPAPRGAQLPGQYHFSRPPHFLPVEFHTEATLRYYPVPVDFSALHERLFAVQFADREFRTFAPEDALIAISVHGSKHLWNRLQWVTDVAWLVSARALDWTAALERARELHVQKMVLTGLALASRLLEARLPGAVEEMVENERDVRFLATTAARELLDPARSAANVFERAEFRVRSVPGRAEGLRYLARLAGSPTEEDRHAAGGNRFTAMLARPWRLAVKYGLRPKPHS
jgi:Uncharacterised nucleotidyltransferase